MNANNHLASNSYVAAYQAEVREGLRDAHRSSGRLEALRGHVRRGLKWSRALFGRGNALKADLRHVREFDHAKSSGACEVHQGLRLAV